MAYRRINSDVSPDTETDEYLRFNEPYPRYFSQDGDTSSTCGTSRANNFLRVVKEDCDADDNVFISSSGKRSQSLSNLSDLSSSSTESFYPPVPIINANSDFTPVPQLLQTSRTVRSNAISSDSKCDACDLVPECFDCCTAFNTTVNCCCVGLIGIIVSSVNNCAKYF